MRRDSIREEVTHVVGRNLPWCVSDTEVLGGEAVIKGTRVPVSLILGHLAGGMSIDELVYEYDLTRENIRAVLTPGDLPHT